MPVYTITNKPAAQLENRRSPDQGAAIENRKEALLGFVLDRSGSMESLVNEAIGSFNTLLSEQQKLQEQDGAGSSFSLALFNDTVSLLHDAVPITEVSPLTRELYAPAGGTALNDAIG
jgi:hypothetical protein